MDSGHGILPRFALALTGALLVASTATTNASAAPGASANVGAEADPTAGSTDHGLGLPHLVAPSLRARGATVAVGATDISVSAVSQLQASLAVSPSS